MGPIGPTNLVVCPTLKIGLEKSRDTPYTIETLATKAETLIDAYQRINKDKMVWSGLQLTNYHFDQIIQTIDVKALKFNDSANLYMARSLSKRG